MVMAMISIRLAGLVNPGARQRRHQVRDSDGEAAVEFFVELRY